MGTDPYKKHLARLWLFCPPDARASETMLSGPCRLQTRTKLECLGGQGIRSMRFNPRSETFIEYGLVEGSTSLCRAAEIGVKV